MQRVRVGVTGLAAVILIVALATAFASGVSRRASLDSARVPTAQTLSNNETPAEPLAQLGVAPGGAEKVVDQTKAKPQP